MSWTAPTAWANRSTADLAMSSDSGNSPPTIRTSAALAALHRGA